MRWGEWSRAGGRARYDCMRGWKQHGRRTPRAATCLLMGSGRTAAWNVHLLPHGCQQGLHLCCLRLGVGDRRTLDCSLVTLPRLQLGHCKSSLRIHNATHSHARSPPPAPPHACPHRGVPLPIPRWTSRRAMAPVRTEGAGGLRRHQSLGHGLGRAPARTVWVWIPDTDCGGLARRTAATRAAPFLGLSPHITPANRLPHQLTASPTARTARPDLGWRGPRGHQLPRPAQQPQGTERTQPSSQQAQGGQGAWWRRRRHHRVYALEPSSAARCRHTLFRYVIHGDPIHPR